MVRTKIGAIPQDDHQNPLVRSNGKSRLATVSWEQKLTAQRAAAIAKWKTISAVSLTSFQFGLQMQLDNSDVGDVLDDIFAGKATSTLHARADTMLRFLAWCRKSGHTAIPFSETVVYAFIQDEGSRSAATFPRSFCCALAFVGHVLECPSALECVASRRVTGHAAKCYKEKRMLVQKPPLKAEHVRMLENVVLGEVPHVKPQDRIAAGFFLFMVYARARFSDAQAAAAVVLDTVSSGDTVYGFVEAQIHRSKSAFNLERKTRYLPMAAPVRGLSYRPWALAWMELIESENLPLGKGRPLLPSPTEKGWSSLPVTASVAAVWLKNLLRAAGSSVPAAAAYGTHSCKATVLSWVAKAGVARELRAILGYHARGVGGTELVYARDNMAHPLREMDKVLEDIRNNKFFPDHTRSGMYRPDAEEERWSAELEDSDCSSSEDSVDEEDLEHVVVEAATDAIMPEWTGNFDLGKMDGFVYFRHPMSRVIHATADESGTHFLCGRDVSTAYLRMAGRPKVLHPTCKQCFGRNLIKDRVG